MPSIRAPASRQTATLQVQILSSAIQVMKCTGLLTHRLQFLFVAHMEFCMTVIFLQVAVKCRPLTDNERRRSRHIIQVIDDKVNRGSLDDFVGE